MSGCTNCKGKAGCDDRKGPMLASIDAELAALYPTQTWGECDALPLAGACADGELLDALAEELAQELNTATFVVHGSDEEPCDYIYALCVGRTPCLLQVRNEGIAVPAELAEATTANPVVEQYLRLVISHRNPMCAVQQVQVSLHPDADATGWVIREAPRAGVYDAPLLKRMQKLVAIVPAYGLHHLDFGEIAHAPPGYRGGSWTTMYGGMPAIANYFFYPQPTTMISDTYVARARHAA